MIEQRDTKQGSGFLECGGDFLVFGGRFAVPGWMVVPADDCVGCFQDRRTEDFARVHLRAGERAHADKFREKDSVCCREAQNEKLFFRAVKFVLRLQETAEDAGGVVRFCYLRIGCCKVHGRSSFTAARRVV